MIITNAMGPGAGVWARAAGRGPSPGRWPGRRAPPQSHRGDSKCIPGRPSATSSTTGPRREGPGVRERDRLARSGMANAYAPADPGRVPGTGRASRTAVPLPGTTVPGAGGTGLDPRACRYRRRRPPVPTCSCGGTGGLSRYIPPERHGVPGAPRRSSTTYRRSETRRCSRGAPRRAPHVPLEGRVRRVPGEHGGRYPPGMYPRHRQGVRPPGTAGAPGTPWRCAGTSPASSRPTCSTCSTAGVLPGGTGARRCCRWGSQGRVPQRGTPPAGVPVPPVPPGAIARTYLPPRYSPGGTGGTASRPGRAPVRDGRTPRTSPAGMYREHRPPYSATAPRVHDPRRRSRSRSPPRRGAPGSRFMMFRNPFPRGRRGEQPPIRPREQGVRGPYRCEFAG